MSHVHPTRSTGTTRRHALRLGAGSAVGAAAVLTTGRATAQSPPTTYDDPAALEAAYDVTLGLYAARLDRAGARRRLLHRPDLRFPLLSTFKVLAAGALLRGPVDLDDEVSYSADDVVENSPVTSQRRRISYADAIDAGLRYSDNTAGNIMLRRIGGPAGLTRFVRSLGDRTTRLDRWEPDLNQATPGDVRDTTTPRAVASTYARLVVGDALPGRNCYLLRSTMEASTTSATKLRSGLPEGWWAADKTGGGAYATQNDVGLITSPSGVRIQFAVLTRTDDPQRQADPGLMADAARLMVARLG